MFIIHFGREDVVIKMLAFSDSTTRNHRRVLQTAQIYVCCERAFLFILITNQLHLFFESRLYSYCRNLTLKDIWGNYL
jgi:hypothetical protein